jgi:hypothetical protein
MRSITLDLEFRRLEAGRDDQEGLGCPTCHERLSLHQPDVDSFDRLLGICPTCGGWFLVDFSPGVMVRLPDMAVLRET